ncbi:SdpI family protein [Dehalogenimonas sp. THU2]|uniref:SdpI family protein n=1 Tax=Dehalogenimonas sp. THU2 TaxID=3151121 RepID=UPI003218BD1F
MKITWRSEALSLILILAMFAMSAITWPIAPDSIPIHWDITGQADGFGGKFEGLLLTPLMTVGIYLMLLFIPRIDPKRANYDKFAGVYRIIRTIMVVFMAALHGVIIASIHGVDINVGTAVMVMAGIMLAVLGNYFGKLKPTWFVGIRTPWTLTSDLSWKKTHQLGGKIFVVFGILMALAGIIGQDWFFYVIFGLFFAAIMFLVFYSYIVWKSDPERGNGLKKS